MSHYVTDHHEHNIQIEHVLFDSWLAETRKLQLEAYGSTPSRKKGDERADYFREMAFAAIVELAEMSNEIGWKSWGTDRNINRPHYIKEAVDVLHFVANLLVLADVSDEELTAAYEAKMQVNRDRMASGSYAGRVEGKCPRCSRAFDDVPQAEGSDVCELCKSQEEVGRRVD